MSTTNVAQRLAKLSPIASFLLAVAVLYTSSVSRSAVNQQQIDTDTKQLQALQQQVAGLQEQLAKQQVIASQLQDLKGTEAQTQQDIHNLADELHSWQREEYRYHHTSSEAGSK